MDRRKEKRSIIDGWSSATPRPPFPETSLSATGRSYKYNVFLSILHQGMVDSIFHTSPNLDFHDLRSSWSVNPHFWPPKSAVLSNLPSPSIHDFPWYFSPTSFHSFKGIRKSEQSRPIVPEWPTQQKPSLMSPGVHQKSRCCAHVWFCIVHLF